MDTVGIRICHALGKKICVLTMEHENNVPEYLGIYDKVILHDEFFWVGYAGKSISIEEWV